MTIQVSACPLGYRYFFDDASTSLNSIWSFSSGQVSAIEITSAGYRASDDGFCYIMANLSASATTVEADFTINETDFPGHTGDFGELLSIYVTSSSNSRFSLNVQHDFSNPIITSIIKLLVINNNSLTEYSETLASNPYNYLTDLPFYYSLAGRIKIIQTSANNAKVYWNEQLRYITSGGSYAFSPTAKIQIGRWFQGSNLRDFCGSIKNISYLSVSGLSESCNSFYVTPRFVASKNSGVSPLYVTLTDTSIVSAVTSATDYMRLWKATNDRTSATEYFDSYTSTVGRVFSGNLDDSFSVSLSAIIS